MIIIFSSDESINEFDTTILKIGKNHYYGRELELLPIRTTHRGLCYKLELLSDRSLKLDLMVSSFSKANDRLKRVDLFIAAKNTWQGTINTWPSSKVPPLVTGELDTESYKLINIYLKENQWNWRTGISDFDNCMDDYNTTNCSSIFDPKSCEHQNM